jgi:hypothetical protein
MLAKNIIVAFALAAVGMASPLEKRWGSGGGSSGGSTNCVCSTGQEPTLCSTASGILGLDILGELCGRSPITIIALQLTKARGRSERSNLLRQRQYPQREQLWKLQLMATILHSFGSTDTRAAPVMVYFFVRWKAISHNSVRKYQKFCPEMSLPRVRNSIVVQLY